MGLLDDQAAGIKTVIESVTDVGLVYDYQPVPVGGDWAAFVSRFSTEINGTRQVRAWTISLLDEDRAYKTIAIGATKLIRKPLWLVRGYLSWQDPNSDQTFRNLIESVVTALDTSRSLGGTAIDHEAVAVTLPNDAQGVLLGDVVCHYAELRISPWFEETLATT